MDDYNSYNSNRNHPLLTLDALFGNSNLPPSPVSVSAEFYYTPDDPIQDPQPPEDYKLEYPPVQAPTLDFSLGAATERFMAGVTIGTTRNNIWYHRSLVSNGLEGYNVRGLVATKDHFFVSCTKVLQMPLPLAAPGDMIPPHAGPRGRSPITGLSKPPFTCTAGVGVAHLLVLPRHGDAGPIDLAIDVSKYTANPAAQNCSFVGGMDRDLQTGNLWFPVTESRPHSHSVIFTVSVGRGVNTEVNMGVYTHIELYCEFEDHLSAVVVGTHNDQPDVWGVTWEGMQFVRLDSRGAMLQLVRNPSLVTLLMDVQSIGDGVVWMSGHLTNTIRDHNMLPAAVGILTLMHLPSGCLIHQIPVLTTSNLGSPLLGNAMWTEFLDKDKNVCQEWENRIFLRVWTIPLNYSMRRHGLCENTTRIKY